MQNDKIKTSRASQTRANTAKKTVWTPPSSLDAPPAPDGYHHRWIRAESMGFDDTKNMAGKLLLARISNELVKSREEYFNKITQDKDDAVDNDLLKDQHPSMPINSERQTRVTFGGTKKS
jgi:hypothetical protein